ncbi:damage-inducible protein CinA [Aquitalea magnusonii]|uniref:CinA family protein n=1 Tax=Aquitalea sp. USM4 TaxID=1590041 RepID=UPI0005F7877E|nr:nicotinamide-nucleotide amidohydrolase family protein [Aquitalea sp. USM4]KJV33959.1 damage-inducible protein CinA [Aquitalea magnusonii]QBJ79815.1 nicotinamide-nucleotide amidohydrolase family protein [Aquitalea sp. USM4]
MDKELSTLSARLGAALLARGETMATAESCTGGMIAAALTDIAGSSAWFGYGMVSYSNQAKQDLLGVSAATLEAHGAVSEAVVREMAAGARQRAAADWAVAVSGVAGPGGGSPEKPVGMVWLAVAGPDGCSRAWVSYFAGDRAAVRRQTVIAALNTVLEMLAGQPLSA